MKRHRTSLRTSSSGSSKAATWTAPIPAGGDSDPFFLTRASFFWPIKRIAHAPQKRGGGAILPFEVGSGDERYRFEPLDNETPERIFERRWALMLLDRAISRLRDEFTRYGSPGD